MFEDRERAAEARYQHDQEFEFRAHARRDRLFGLDVAARLGKSGSDADDYAHGLVTLFAPHRDQAVVAKVKGDLAAAGMTMTEAEIAAWLTAFDAQARAQLEAEGRAAKPA
jgi:hypothetical protein